MEAQQKRDFKSMEARRLKGAKLLSEGLTKSEVAERLGVTRQTVTVWEQRLHKGGVRMLKSRSSPWRNT